MFWMKKKASSSQDTGRWGESQALHHLVRRGYTVVATNYRKRFGEIDIIARDRDVLVFIEVKCRGRLTFGTPLEAVDRRKQQRICRVAMAYMQSHQCGECNARFDVISVQPDPQSPAGKGQALIEHIENAFDFSL